MTNTKLPQHYCYNQGDHPAHTVPSSVYPHAAREFCPGRHTGHGFETTAPIAHPMDADPFAGIDSIWD